MNACSTASISAGVRSPVGVSRIARIGPGRSIADASSGRCNAETRTTTPGVVASGVLIRNASVAPGPALIGSTAAG